MTKEKLKEANELLQDIENAEYRLETLKNERMVKSDISMGHCRVRPILQSQIADFIIDLHEKELIELQKQFDKL